jgi:hypothetical protein
MTEVLERNHGGRPVGHPGEMGPEKPQWFDQPLPCGVFYAETGYDAWFGPDEDELEVMFSTLSYDKAKEARAESIREHVNVARTICQSCPVQRECLRFAMENGIDAGIWGGMTRYQRTQLRNQVAA